MKSFDDFRPYQRAIGAKIEELPGSLIALDMGMGKTVICLRMIRRKMLMEFRRVLIVGTYKVAERVWLDEVEEWRETQGIKVVPIMGTDKQRKDALKKKARIFTTNRENFPWLWKHFGKKWPYDCVIWDDAGGLKSWKHRTPNGTLTRFGALAKARVFMKKFIILTGTPTPKGIYDLGGQIFLVDQGRRLGREREAFEQRWFEKDFNGYGFEPLDHSFDEITELCKDVMFSLQSEDYIDLPPKIISPVKVDLPPKVLKEYRKFERSLVSDTYDVEAVNRGVLHNKLLQFANGAMYRNFEDGSREVVQIHKEKIDALDRIVSENHGENLLIAYQFKFDIPLIKKYFPRVVIEDDEPDFVKLWNKRKIRLGLTHAASLGHGINLQFGGHLQAWYGLTNSLELWLQFNRRLQRSGQENDYVMIYPIIAKGTADETTLQSLDAKNATQDRVNKAIRLRIQEWEDDEDDYRENRR